jgi:hypothetical protein
MMLAGLPKGVGVPNAESSHTLWGERKKFKQFDGLVSFTIKTYQCHQRRS